MLSIQSSFKEDSAIPIASTRLQYNSVYMLGQGERGGAGIGNAIQLKVLANCVGRICKIEVNLGSVGFAFSTIVFNEQSATAAKGKDGAFDVEKFRESLRVLGDNISISDTIEARAKDPEKQFYEKIAAWITTIYARRDKVEQVLDGVLQSIITPTDFDNTALIDKMEQLKKEINVKLPWCSNKTMPATILEAPPYIVIDDSDTHSANMVNYITENFPTHEWIKVLCFLMNLDVVKMTRIDLDRGWIKDNLPERGCMVSAANDFWAQIKNTLTVRAAAQLVPLSAAEEDYYVATAHFKIALHYLYAKHTRPSQELLRQWLAMSGEKGITNRHIIDFFRMYAAVMPVAKEGESGWSQNDDTAVENALTQHNGYEFFQPSIADDGDQNPYSMLLSAQERSGLNDYLGKSAQGWDSEAIESDTGFITAVISKLLLYYSSDWSVVAQRDSMLTTTVEQSTQVEVQNDRMTATDIATEGQDPREQSEVACSDGEHQAEVLKLTFSLFRPEVFGAKVAFAAGVAVGVGVMSMARSRN